jgi:hypothetical protein
LWEWVGDSCDIEGKKPTTASLKNTIVNATTSEIETLKATIAQAIIHSRNFSGGFLAKKTKRINALKRKLAKLESSAS